MTLTKTDVYIDQVIAKRFKIKYLVGQGTMGSVYYAEDISQKEKPLAIKFIAENLVNENLKRRFAREAHICAQLGKKSPHIVQVKAYGVHEEKSPFYAMEFLEGQNLKEMLNEQTLSLPRFFKICRQICLGLEVAHQGVEIKGEICPVIHRDIKPGNILVTSDSQGGELVKILDFGIAKLVGSQLELTKTKDFMGTPAYCSPEQMEGKQLDRRSDIYSLGVVIFHLLTGQGPWETETINSYGCWYKIHHSQPPRSFVTVNSSLKIPKQLENLVMHCLAKKPSDRPQNMGEVLKALEKIERELKTTTKANTKANQPIEKAPKKEPLIESNQLVLSKLDLNPVIEAQIEQRSLLTLNECPLRTAAELLCWQTSWPKNKPVAKIVFPQAIQTTKETLATLWVMLPKQQIVELLQDIATIDSHKFIACMSPHPLLLWNTVIYGQHEPRWLPCYLDLQTKQGQSITRLLATKGIYRVIFFALEEPQRCAHVMTFVIPPSVRESLKNWLNSSQESKSSAQAEESKKILQAEFDKVKPMMLQILSSQLGKLSANNISETEPKISESKKSFLALLLDKILVMFG